MTPTSPLPRRTVHVLTVSLALALTACGQSTSPAITAAGTLHAEHAWLRATPPGAAVAGGYMQLRNDGATDDRLVSVTSPDAQRVEIHEMRMAGGTMQMRQLADGVAVPAGSTVTLKPGGVHLMFIAPTHAFKPGDKIEATLTYAHARAETLVFPVQSLGATSGPADTASHDGH